MSVSDSLAGLSPILLIAGMFIGTSIKESRKWDNALNEAFNREAISETVRPSIKAVLGRNEQNCGKLPADLQSPCKTVAQIANQIYLAPAAKP